MYGAEPQSRVRQADGAYGGPPQGNVFGPVLLRAWYPGGHERFHGLPGHHRLHRLARPAADRQRVGRAVPATADQGGARHGQDHAGAEHRREASASRWSPGTSSRPPRPRTASTCTTPSSASTTASSETTTCATSSATSSWASLGEAFVRPERVVLLDRRDRQGRPRVPQRPAVGARSDGVLHPGDRRDHARQSTGPW